MKDYITVYRVYWAVAEMKYQHGHKPEINQDTVSEALYDDSDPTLKATFETEAEAEAYIKKTFPVIRIDHPAGMGVKFIRVSGCYVQIDEITMDEEGNVVDCDYAGTGYISEFPEDYEDE